MQDTASCFGEFTWAFEQIKNGVVSIDIGFIHMAVVVITEDLKILESETHDISVQKGQKLAVSQTNLINNIFGLIAEINQKYNVTHWIIEQQIGKFAAFQAMSLVHAAVMTCSNCQNIQYISPRSKLTLKFCEFEPNPKIAKYHQNKNQAVAQCKAWLTQTGQSVEKLDRDQSDAILQALFVLMPKS